MNAREWNRHAEMLAALEAASADMEMMHPGSAAAGEMTDAEFAHLWNATKKAIDEAITKGARVPA